jgi:hypothetical protein
MVATWLGIFRCFCRVCWLVCLDTTYNSATLLWSSAVVIKGYFIASLLRMAFNVLSIFLGLHESFWRGVVTRLGWFLALATRQSINDLCLSNHIVISSHETPSSF